MEKLTPRIPATSTNGSTLPPIVYDPSSAYFHPSGIPVTAGDYEQRVKNQILLNKKPKLGLGWRKSSLGVGSFLVGGTILAVYTANVLMVYENVRIL